MSKDYITHIERRTDGGHSVHPIGKSPRHDRPSLPRPTARKITDAQLAQMQALDRMGITRVCIAQRFGVSRSCVSILLNGQRRVYTAPQLEQAS